MWDKAREKDPEVILAGSISAAGLAVGCVRHTAASFHAHF